MDHVRGPAKASVIVEYGDYECLYSRRAFREIERADTQAPGAVRFASDTSGETVVARIQRDVRSGLASDQLQGTPTRFIHGVVQLGAYDAQSLLEALRR